MVKVSLKSPSNMWNFPTNNLAIVEKPSSIRQPSRAYMTPTLKIRTCGVGERMVLFSKFRYPVHGRGWKILRHSKQNMCLKQHMHMWNQWSCCCWCSTQNWAIFERDNCHCCCCRLESWFIITYYNLNSIYSQELEGFFWELEERTRLGLRCLT